MQTADLSLVETSVTGPVAHINGRPTHQTLPHEPTVLQLRLEQLELGTPAAALLELLIQVHMVNQVALARMAAVEALPVADLETANGVMESMSQALPTLELSVNSSVYPTTRQKYIAASTSPTTMTSRSKRLATMFRNLFSSSPTHPSMTISCPTSSWRATRHQPQFRSTQYQL